MLNIATGAPLSPLPSQKQDAVSSRRSRASTVSEAQRCLSLSLRLANRLSSVKNSPRCTWCNFVFGCGSFANITVSWQGRIKSRVLSGDFLIARKMPGHTQTLPLGRYANARDRAAMAEQETMDSDDDFEPTRKRFKQLTIRDLDSCQWPESPHLPNECSGEHGVSILYSCFAKAAKTNGRH